MPCSTAFIRHCIYYKLRNTHAIRAKGSKNEIPNVNTDIIEFLISFVEYIVYC